MAPTDWRTVETGTPIKIHGKRGQWTFGEFVESEKGSWVWAYGGANGRQSWRAVSPWLCSVIPPRKKRSRPA